MACTSAEGRLCNAVRARLDWKYALALDIDDPGFDATILGDFRKRLLASGAEERLLTRMLDTLIDAGFLQARRHQRSDSTHVLTNVRLLTRMTLVAETLRATLNDLADVAPAWLAAHLDPAWAERYAVRVEEYRLPKAAPVILCPPGRVPRLSGPLSENKPAVSFTGGQVYQGRFSGLRQAASAAFADRSRGVYAYGTRELEDDLA